MGSDSIDLSIAALCTRHVRTAGKWYVRTSDKPVSRNRLRFPTNVIEGTDAALLVHSVGIVRFAISWL